MARERIVVGELDWNGCIDCLNNDYFKGCKIPDDEIDRFLEIEDEWVYCYGYKNREE